MSEPQGCVVWISGRPSAGKSTFAVEARPRLQSECGPSLILDGDQVRERLVPTPGYTPSARADFYATLAGLAALLANQGLLVLVAATAHKREYRARARELAPRFLEVFVDTPREVCESRDDKGLYAASRDGTISGVPGVTEPFEPPGAPDVLALGGRDESALRALIQAVQQLRA